MKWDPNKLKHSDVALPYKAMARPAIDALDQLLPNAGIGQGWDGIWNPIDAPFDSDTSEYDSAAREAIEGASQDIDDLKVPTLGDYTPEIQKWLADYTASQGTAAPAVRADKVTSNLADASLQGPSEMAGVSSDPRMKEAQLAALAQLQDIGANGGMTASDRADLNRTQSEVAQADRGRREAILQNMRARGMGGGGNELLAQLSSSQAATDRANQTGLDINGMAQQRALAALQQAGTMAGSIRGQGFGEDSAKAQAMDAVARFNAANTQQANQFNAGVLNDTSKSNSQLGLQSGMFNAGQKNDMTQFNTGAKNQAGIYNNKGKQDVANNNTDIGNKASLYNTAEKPKQQYDMQANKVGMKAGMSGKLADLYTAEADRKAQSAGNMMGGLATMGGAAAMAFSDERLKEDIKPIGGSDIDEFLRKLKAKSYKFKEGTVEDTAPKAGWMMQDIDNTKLGKLASRETEDGVKGYDPQSMQGIMLAALKHLSDKIDKKG